MQPSLRFIALLVGISGILAAESATVLNTGCRIDTFTVASPSMGRDIRAVVVLPPAYLADDQIRLPLLVALHGRRAPYTTWSDMVPLKRALAEHPMIVASFDGDAASWYLDAPENPQSRFTTFFFNEFIPQLEATYRCDPQRRGITGFSMGGFGALHLHLTKPGFFTAISSLSGAFGTLGEFGSEAGRDLTALLGDPAAHADRYRDLRLEQRLADNVATMPPLYLHCGTEDRFIETQQRIVAHLRAVGLGDDRLTVLATAGGHDWPFWRDASAGIIAFHGAAFQAAR